MGSRISSTTDPIPFSDALEGSGHGTRGHAFGHRRPDVVRRVACTASIRCPDRSGLDVQDSPRICSGASPCIQSGCFWYQSLKSSNLLDDLRLKLRPIGLEVRLHLILKRLQERHADSHGHADKSEKGEQPHRAPGDHAPAGALRRARAVERGGDSPGDARQNPCTDNGADNSMTS